MAAFPGGLAVFAGFTSSHTLAADSHAAQHNLEQAEILAAQTKIGTGASTASNGTFLRGTGAGTSAWQQVTLTSDVTGILPAVNGGTGQNSLTALPLPSPTISGTVAGGATYTSPTLTTPTIASFVSATHSHQNAAGGGTLALAWNQATLFNPYKFSTYRAAAANTGNAAFAVIAFDTEEYDTNNNCAAGVYTAPVTGFYQFQARASQSAGTRFICSFFKNGAEFKRGIDLPSAQGGAMTADMSLAAGDTVDVRAFGNAANALEVDAGASCYFQGRLVSHT